jgi:thioredoxin reductase (NADPH)
VRFLPRTSVVEIRGGTVLLSPEQEIAADFVLLMTGYRQDTKLFDMLGVKLEGTAREPVHDPDTMETNVPGVFIAGTAVAGTPPRKVAVIVETCHVHIPRIVAAINGRRVALADGRLDD